MYRYIPNIICYMRMVLGGVLWWSVTTLQPTVSLLVLSVGVASDFLDGFIARRWHVASVRGVFLDPLADKVLVILGFLALYQQNLVAWWVILIIAGRDLFITGLRSWLLARQRQLQTLWLAKIKTVVQFGALYLFIIGSAAYYGVWFDATITQRIAVGHTLQLLGAGVAGITVFSALLYLPQLIRGGTKL